LFWLGLIRLHNFLKIFEIASFHFLKISKTLAKNEDFLAPFMDFDLLRQALLVLRDDLRDLLEF
jgi:hypothetical protein